MDPEELEAVSETRLRAEVLSAIPNIRHEFASRLEAAPQGLWRPRQVHGRTIAEPRGRPQGREADGALAREGDPPVGVVTADCVPLLLAHATGSRGAAIHAGWKGCSLGIVEAAVERLGSPESLVAALGPAASSGYEVGREVLEALSPLPERVVPTRPGHALLDLRGHVADRLASVGVPGASIEIVGPCTIGSLRWPSYRREGASAGRAVAWIEVADRALPHPKKSR